MTLFKPRVGKVIFAQTTGGLSVIIPDWLVGIADIPCTLTYLPLGIATQLLLLLHAM